MKKTISTLLIFFILIKTTHAQTSPAFEIKYSKPLSVLRFLEAAVKENHYSVTYNAIIENQFNDAAFQNLKKEFSSIRFDYSYQWYDFPQSRRTHRGVGDLINIAAVNAASIEDFNRRIIGILPNEDYIRFISCMKKAEVYHDILFKNQDAKTQAQMAAYEPYKPVLTEIFQKTSKFYGTAWANDIPFVVCLYPIPEKRGNTSATPHGNTLVCAFLSENPKDYLSRLGIVTHEMCHILYDGQSAALQKKLEGWFLNNPSPYRRMAYNYIDEGLATAIGNGWAYEKINNAVDTSSWYNDDYIDAFGHALFPMVKEYITQGKTIDSLFVDKAIKAFAEKLPNSIYDYNALMNSLNIYGSMADGNVEAVSKTIRQYFRVSSYSLSTPIMEEQTKQLITSTEGTKMFLIDSNIDKNWTYLLSNFSIFNKKLNKIKPSPGQLYAFLNEKNEAILVLVFDSIPTLNSILKTMLDNKVVDIKKVLQN